jgi:hypothetical protein
MFNDHVGLDVFLVCSMFNDHVGLDVFWFVQCLMIMLVWMFFWFVQCWFGCFFVCSMFNDHVGLDVFLVCSIFYEHVGLDFLVCSMYPFLTICSSELNFPLPLLGESLSERWAPLPILTTFANPWLGIWYLVSLHTIV